MKWEAMIALIQMAYSFILRPLLVNAINDPDQDWDNKVLDIIDRIFQYEPWSKPIVPNN